jgi:hypothetical protein
MGNQATRLGALSGAGEERVVREEGSGFRVQGSGFRVQGSGFRVQDREPAVSRPPVIGFELGRQSQTVGRRRFTILSTAHP